MKETKEVFIHGLESSSQGTKGRFFRHLRPEMIIEDYTGGFRERMAKLEERLSGMNNLVLVGSSYGGLMAAVYACSHPERIAKLVLLAPALHLKEFSPYRDCKVGIPTVIYHGRWDEVVPLTEVRSIAHSVFLSLSYHVVDDDHALNNVFAKLPWEEILTP
ncbi:MAG TPA: alpha/beta fold hydrolase [Syntrophales bacterium]|nr:alpha/beta fold hydrolase [Syntrophales bacterium]HOL59882.1 alpha/beta fold hydrolase [Syntrophales bacterium]HPO36029.1 alpha/beta fold hydrolase [Syntrophales bacterium]